MKIQDVRKMAKCSQIDSFGKSKTEIIRALQKTEGNFDCYGRATSGFCDQAGCRWKEDCLTESVGETPAKAKAQPEPKTTAAPKTVKRAAPRKK